MDNNTITKFFILFLFSTSIAFAQMPIDGFFTEKGTLNLTASYGNSTFDEFYVGEMKVGPVPVHNEISQNIFSLYGTYALSDDLGLIVNLPYIASSGEGGADPVNGQTEQNDFQDLGIYAKYRFAQSDFSGGNINYLAGFGFSIPLGYEPNGLLSNGSGSFNTDLSLGGQWNTDVGLFTSLIAGYSFRGNAVDNLGTNGGDDLDVPNAFLLNGKLGYTSKGFYADAYVRYQSSSDGRDISDDDFGGRFPETQVDYTVLGISTYVPLSSCFGVSAGYGTVVDGRNVGDSNIFNVGVTFKFKTGSNTQ
ncbi:hypothetical protein [Winogradskyella sp. A3E31]|uniref:hypothetical protein n=1 Tax=Winogradskyella sp. A3E31 TaxID=3349637 RepID=UPI00398AA225